MRQQINEKLDTLTADEEYKVLTFLERLEAKSKLLPVFEEKLKTIKNNPVDESAIATKQKHLDDEQAKVLKATAFNESIEIIKQEAKENNIDTENIYEILEAAKDTKPKELEFMISRAEEAIQFLEENELKQDELEDFIEDTRKDEVETRLDLLESIYTIEELDKVCTEHNCDVNDLVNFSSAVVKKVFDFKEMDQNKELVFKEIESHSELKPVSYIGQKEIRKCYKSVNFVSEDIQKALKNKSYEKLEDLNSKLKAKTEKLDEVIAKFHDLDTEKMSEWETSLLREKIIASCFGQYKPPVGKK